MKIFVDLDGVLTAFIEQLSRLLGEPVNKDFGNDPKIWKAIDDAGSEFWSSMSWMPGAHKLWDELKKFSPTILTSPSRHESSKKGKKEWLKDNLPGVPFIIEQDKEKYAAPDAILIDDREDNIKKWEEKGGIGILHKSVPQTLVQLSHAIQNMDAHVIKMASMGKVKFYNEASNSKVVFALIDKDVYMVKPNGGYPLFDKSKITHDDLKGNIKDGKFLEVPFSNLIDYPTQGEGTSYTPY